MNGTVPTKVARLTADLLVHPDYAQRYISHNLLNKRSPLDLEMPWFSYAAIDFLSEWLKPQMTVCEYGSGGSTVFFARRVKSVFAIEDNAEWSQRVRERLAEKSLTNATVHLCPYDFKNPTEFEKSDYLRSMPDQSFDVIVVDSTEEWTLIRPILFHHAETHIRQGGIIVVDDSWRYPELRSQNLATHFKTFQSVGPARPGVTSTDVFFY